MYKTLTLAVVFILLNLTSQSRSQSRPSLQFTAGLAFPGNEFAGELVTENEAGISYISSDFIKNNYAASTGASVTGSLNFPFSSSGLFSSLLTGSYSYFNAFKSSIFGTTIENNLSVPVSFDNRISVTTVALGLQVSPSVSPKISPFLNANMGLNILSISLSRNDAASVIFSDAVRLGIVTNAGLTYKINNEYGFILNGSYNMSNLFFKSSSDSYNDRIQYYSDDNQISDKEGSYYSNLSDPDYPPVKVQGNNKNVNWWSINLGLSIMLGKSDKK